MLQLAAESLDVRSLKLFGRIAWLLATIELNSWDFSCGEGRENLLGVHSRLIEDVLINMRSSSRLLSRLLKFSHLRRTANALKCIKNCVKGTFKEPSNNAWRVAVWILPQLSHPTWVFPDSANSIKFSLILNFTSNSWWFTLNPRRLLLNSWWLHRKIMILPWIHGELTVDSSMNSPWIYEMFTLNS